MFVAYKSPELALALFEWASAMAVRVLGFPYSMASFCAVNVSHHRQSFWHPRLLHWTVNDLFDHMVSNHNAPPN